MGWLQGWRACWGLGCSRPPVMLFPRSSQGFLHLKFAWTRENQLVLGQHSGPFASVPELVLHYSSRPLPVQGAEHLALLYPVVTQSPCPGAPAPALLREAGGGQRERLSDGIGAASQPPSGS